MGGSRGTDTSRQHGDGKKDDNNINMKQISETLSEPMEISTTPKFAPDSSATVPSNREDRLTDNLAYITSAPIKEVIDFMESLNQEHIKRQIVECDNKG